MAFSSISTFNCAVPNGSLSYNIPDEMLLMNTQSISGHRNHVQLCRRIKPNNFFLVILLQNHGAGNCHRSVKNRYKNYAEDGHFRFLLIFYYFVRKQCSWNENHDDVDMFSVCYLFIYLLLRIFLCTNVFCLSFLLPTNDNPCLPQEVSTLINFLPYNTHNVFTECMKYI